MTPESFRVVLNTLVPPNPVRGIPGAGDAGTAGYIAEQLAKDEALQKVFDNGLGQLSELAHDPFETLPESARIAALRDIETRSPAFFGQLIRLTYMGYYSRPDIRGLLGLSPEPVHPAGYDVKSESPDLMSEMTAPVVNRGKVYRDDK